MEPLIIRIVTIGFTASSAIIQGLVSDNTDQNKVEQELDVMKDEIKDDIERFKKEKKHKKHKKHKNT